MRPAKSEFFEDSRVSQVMGSPMSVGIWLYRNEALTVARFAHNPGSQHLNSLVGGFDVIADQKRGSRLGLTRCFMMNKYSASISEILEPSRGRSKTINDTCELSLTMLDIFTHNRKDR